MLNIRFFEKDDAESVYRIYLTYFDQGGITFETVPPALDDFTERITGIAEKYPFYVAENNGIVLGYAYACEHRTRAAYRWAVESSVYIAENAKGLGLGSLLYERLIGELQRRNFKLIYALITLPNEGSIKLHKRFGFAELAIHRNAGFKLGSWHDVMWMEKSLALFGDTPQEPVYHAIE